MAFQVRTVSKIINENREATREELEEIFQRSVLGKELDPRKLRYFRTQELKRIIACELYYTNVKVQKKRRTMIIHHLSILLGRHSKALLVTLDKYFTRSEP